jgi:hypothetical protein
MPITGHPPDRDFHPARCAELCSARLVVGTPVTRRPPHRPGRAVFPHPVLRLDSLPRESSQLPVSRSSGYSPQGGWLVLSSPTCPARVSFAGCVLPSGPSPCGWLSQPLSTMPDKTPQWHLTASQRPTWFVDNPRQEHSGASRVLRHISSCMPRPDDSGGPPHPRQSGCFCIAFGAR